MYQKINLHTIKVLLVQLCAITCVFGEKMNERVPHASLYFTIFGMVLVVVNLLAPNYTFGLLNMEDRINLKLVEWIIFISLIISTAKIALGYSAGIFNELRQFVLSLIVLNIVMVMIRDRGLIPKFMKLASYSFTITFIASYGFLYNAERHTGFYKDPNSMARVAIECIVFSICLIINRKKYKIKNIFPVIISIGVCAVAIFLSGSRGCILGVLVALVYLLIASSISLKYKLTIFACVVLGVIVLWQFVGNDNELIKMLLRYIGKNNEAGDGYSTNVRWQMWRAYLDNIWDYFWIGNFDGQPQSYYSFYRSAHNSLLEMFVTYGITAFVPFLILQIRLLFKKSKKDIFSVAMKWLFIALFISSMFISTNDEKASWLSIIMMLIPTAEKNTSANSQKD